MKPLRKPTAFKALVDMFFTPIMKKRPKNIEPTAWLKAMLHVHTRHIEMFRAKSAFKMPGTYKVRPLVTIPGVGPNKVKKDAVLYVRTDSAAPATVEVEVETRLDEQEAWFQMSKEDWRKIKHNLEPISLKKK